MNAPLDRFVPSGTVLLAPRAGLNKWTPSGTVRSDTGPDRLVEAVPEDYGAVGDGGSHPAGDHLGVATLAQLREWNGGIYSFAESLDDEMDWLGIQAILYDNAVAVLRGEGQNTYLMKRGLQVRNGMIHTVDFSGSRLDFTQMQATPASGGNLVTNGTFSSGSGWSNTTLSPRTDWTFGGGFATWTDPGVGAGSQFGQFGQQVTLPVGRWTVSATLNIQSGASAGFYGVPYLGFAFCLDGVGINYAGSPVTKSVTKNSEDSETISFSFEIFDAPATVYLTFSGGNADLTVTDVVITDYFLNAAIWCNGANFGSQPFDSTIWRGGEIVGPGRDSGVRGFLHQTLESNDSRCNVYDANLTGFSGGQVFADQAFLEIISGGSTGECDPCLQFVANSQNAGENIRVSNHIFYNSGLILDLAGGGEFFFFGTSFDYSDKIIKARRAAVVRMHGVHIEVTPPSTTLRVINISADFTSGAILTGGTSGALATLIEVPTAGSLTGDLVLDVTSGAFLPTEGLTDSSGGVGQAYGDVVFGDVLFDLDGESSVSIESGEVLLAGAGHRGAPHLIRVNDSFSTMELPSALYNLQTASGRLATGSGVVRITGRGHVWPGNALLGLLFSDNFLMDKFGGAGRIVGPSTASDMSFPAPSDGVGVLCAMHCDSAPTTRISTAGEVVATIDPAYGPDATHGSLSMQITGGYTGLAEWRAYYPVRAGEIALDEFQYAKPAVCAPIAHGPYLNGVPGAGDTIRVSTVSGSSVVTVDDKHVATIGTFGPQEGWTVTLAGVAGNPGGIPNAAFNTTHTIIDRTGTDTFTIDVGTAASSTVSAAGGAGIGSTYSQTNVLIFDRRFWVNVIGYDSVGRPIIGQEAFQGETDFLLPMAATGWTQKNMVSYYTIGSAQADPTLRYSRGRAPAWATHMMMVLNLQMVRDMAGPPPLYLGGYIANGV